MEYKIVSGKNIAELEAAVKRAIADGWKPLGGVCAWSGGMMIMQALARG
jgi:hypothetical protein